MKHSTGTTEICTAQKTRRQITIHNNITHKTPICVHVDISIQQVTVYYITIL